MFFQLSSGLSDPIVCTKGTLKRIHEHIAEIERALPGIAEIYNGKKRWCHFKVETAIDSLRDKEACSIVAEHNNFCHWLYGRFAVWSAHPAKYGETITQEKAEEFWFAIEHEFGIKSHRWTANYYEERMNAIYEAMRGRENDDGLIFDGKPLSPEQADAVINMFCFLDTHDIRLSVPKGRDELYRSDSYAWSAVCGAIHEQDVLDHYRTCRKKGCRKDLFDNVGDIYGLASS